MCSLCQVPNILVCDQVIDALPEPVLLGKEAQADSSKLREGAAAGPAHATQCTPCTWTGTEEGNRLEGGVTLSGRPALPPFTGTAAELTPCTPLAHPG
jgi:hypothetical protein